MMKLALSKIKSIFKDTSLMLGITIFLVILGHFLIGGARYIKHSLKGVKTGTALLDEASMSPVFSGYDQYDEYFKELKGPPSELQVFPYYHWRRSAMNGIAIQVNEQGMRKTIKNPDPSAKKVFMFGGSTMWGTGTPDKYTIPSRLQALLGPKYDVYNFGETAFVSAQELNLLLEQLSKGFIPDIVIFYDGVNDTYASLYSPGKIRHPQFSPEDYTSKTTLSYLLLKLAEKTNYIAITERFKLLLHKDPISQWEKNVSSNLDAKAQETINQYVQLMRQVKALGNEYGFEVHHFWQPLLFTENRTLTEYEQKIFNQEHAALIKSYQTTYEIAHKLDGKDNFYYLANIFDNINNPIYFDFCHMGPKGYNIVAENIYKLAFKQQ